MSDNFGANLKLFFKWLFKPLLKYMRFLVFIFFIIAVSWFLIYYLFMDYFNFNFRASLNITGQILQLIGVLLVLIGVYSKFLKEHISWFRKWIEQFPVWKPRIVTGGGRASGEGNASVKGEVISSDLTLKERVNKLENKVSRNEEKIRKLEDKINEKYNKIKEELKEYIQNLVDNINRIENRLNSLKDEMNRDYKIETAGAVFLIIGLVMSVWANFLSLM